MAKTDDVIASFLAHRQGVTGPDGANYQLFLAELAPALSTLEPASNDHAVKPAATTCCG